MTVGGKYSSKFTSEALWLTLLSADAICYAVPEFDRLERVESTHPMGDDQRVWQGTGSMPGAGDLGTGIVTILACNLEPYTAYTLQIEGQVGTVAISVLAKIILTSNQQQLGTLIRWEASILDAMTGRSHPLFEWMAGLMAQHFFKRIDQYLALPPDTVHDDPPQPEGRLPTIFEDTEHSLP